MHDHKIYFSIWNFSLKKTCQIMFMGFTKHLFILCNLCWKQYDESKQCYNTSVETCPSQCLLKKFQTLYFDKPGNINIGPTSFWCSYSFLAFETQVKVNYFNLKFRSCLRTPLMNVCLFLSLIDHAKRIISTGKQTDF